MGALALVLGSGLVAASAALFASCLRFRSTVSFLLATYLLASAEIVALSLLNSAYLSEIFRGSIQAVDRGQRDAALALGLSRPRAFTSVTLPQAFRVALPATTNQLIDIVKDSSILAVIGVRELMRETQRLANQHFRPFEFYTATMGMYLGLVAIVSFVMNRVEKALRVNERGPRVRGPRLFSRVVDRAAPS